MPEYLQLPGIERTIWGDTDFDALSGAGGKSGFLLSRKQISLWDLPFSQKSLDLASDTRFFFDIASAVLPETAAVP